MDLKSLFRKKEKMPTCSAVILAAGSSQRMGKDKTFMQVGSMPVLVRTLLAFEKSEHVDEIIVVTRVDKIEDTAELCHGNGISKLRMVIGGGATRMESALAGVSACKKDAKLIAIHDGARPFVTNELISRTVYAAEKFISAVPAIPSTDTLKEVDENGVVISTPDRSRIFRVQTPQIFHADMIKGALTKAASEHLPITDDCSAMDMMGIKTHVVEGDVDNIKLTTPNDIITAEAILKNRGDF